MIRSVKVDEEQSELRRILRALPRKRVALVRLVVALNVGAVTYWRGLAIGRQRGPRVIYGGWNGISGTPEEEARNAEWGRKLNRAAHEESQTHVVPPWDWTADEWAETWPWH